MGHERFRGSKKEYLPVVAGLRRQEEMRELQLTASKEVVVGLINVRCRAFVANRRRTSMIPDIGPRKTPKAEMADMKELAV